MTEKVLYAELTPQEFRERLAAAPIAYLPLGTLEWHGEHLPLGSDGIQSQGFFAELAREVGGIVVPMLFLGPDRVQRDGDRVVRLDRPELAAGRTSSLTRPGRELYGMDICHTGTEAQRYESQQLPGSAYWVPDETFTILLDAVMKQLARAGFRIVVGHGHGPSTTHFSERRDVWREQYGLELFHCWGGEHDGDGLGIQVDHAAMNETSLVMALRPELVHMENLPEDRERWPLAVAGQDPREFASPEVGRRAIALQKERMAGLLREALARPL